MTLPTCSNTRSINQFIDVLLKPLPRWVALLIALILSLFFALRPILLRPPLVLGQDAFVEGAAPVSVELRQKGGTHLYIQPKTPANTLLIFYPGGLVRPQAYEWLGHALAAEKVQTIIPVFPFDLAVTNSNRAANLIQRYGQGKTIILAGHSLGGAMAAQFAGKNADKIDGLLLMASYPAKNNDLKDSKLEVLSLKAELDGVAASKDVEDGLRRLPKSARLVTIPGAVHSFFGRYGPQKGDGQPKTTRAKAEALITEELKAFLVRVRSAAQNQPKVESDPRPNKP